MNPANVFIAAGVLAVLWYIVTTIRIYDALRKRNMPVNFVFLNVLILKYVSDYREVTLKETGKVGPLFYHWLISINIALASAILIWLVRM